MFFDSVKRNMRFNTRDPEVQNDSFNFFFFLATLLTLPQLSVSVCKLAHKKLGLLCFWSHLLFSVLGIGRVPFGVALAMAFSSRFLASLPQPPVYCPFSGPAEAQAGHPPKALQETLQSRGRAGQRPLLPPPRGRREPSFGGAGVPTGPALAPPVHPSAATTPRCMAHHFPGEKSRLFHHPSLKRQLYGAKRKRHRR